MDSNHQPQQLDACSSTVWPVNRIAVLYQLSYIMFQSATANGGQSNILGSIFSTNIISPHNGNSTNTTSGIITAQTPINNIHLASSRISLAMKDIV
jgi:hypothetical protein